jgi:hypothetical protein
VLTVLSYRRDKPAFFFAAFAFLILLPASNLFFPIGTIMAERLLYLPFLGVVGALVLAFEGMAAKRKLPAPVVLAVLGVLAVACCARTIVRNPDWTIERWPRLALQVVPKLSKFTGYLPRNLLNPTRPPRE